MTLMPLKKIILHKRANGTLFTDVKAFVLPSHWKNFGVAVVEALGCGKPVLISNQVNIWKEIKDESVGMIAMIREEEQKICQ